MKFIITESQLRLLVSNTLNEINAPGMFLNIFPSVDTLVTRDVKKQPLLGGLNNTNIISIWKKDIKTGQPIPNTKFSYKLTGVYKFIRFDIRVRNVRRDTQGYLRAEVQPTNSFVNGVMKSLISDRYLTSDGWLAIAAPPDKINAAFADLHRNKGSEAELSLPGGIDIKLQEV